MTDEEKIIKEAINYVKVNKKRLIESFLKKIYNE